jgi:hypothetical protein
MREELWDYYDVTKARSPAARAPKQLRAALGRDINRSDRADGRRRNRRVSRSLTRRYEEASRRLPIKQIIRNRSRWQQVRSSLAAGDDGGVDRPNRDARDPIGEEVGLGQCFVDARLVGAESAATLQQKRNAVEGRPMAQFVGLSHSLCPMLGTRFRL